MKNKEIYLKDEELSVDSVYILSELLEEIPKLQKKYGKHATLFFDAGYNNVSPVIIPSKKVKGEK